jgi:hypothetical protein
MTHGRGSEGETGEWSGEQVLFTLPRNMVYPALIPLLSLMRTPQLPVVDWTDAPSGLNGLIRFAERRNLVSARVPSHFKRSLRITWVLWFVEGSYRWAKSQLSIILTCYMEVCYGGMARNITCWKWFPPSGATPFYSVPSHMTKHWVQMWLLCTTECRTVSITCYWLPKRVCMFEF